MIEYKLFFILLLIFICILIIKNIILFQYNKASKKTKYNYILITKLFTTY